MYVPELHEQYLKEEYFPMVMSIQRNPRYKNKRSMDPQMKCFLDEHQIEESPDWGLPKPNAEAAYKSLSKYEKDLLYMSPDMVEDMNLAWEWTERHFGPYMCDSRVRSAEEVIENLDKTTSTGAPFNLKYAKKRELFEQCDIFIDWINADWERLAVDPDWTSPSTNSLKEEIRPTVKTKQNKIRTFMAMAADITIHGNRLFADMNEKMNQSYLCSSSAVGMSIYGGNWNRLYNKLRTFRKGYALDESEYDSSLRAYMMWGCAQFRWKQLRKEDQTPENLQRLKTIYRNLVNTLIISPDGIMLMKLAGNPSGSMNTINDNTLILFTLMAFAWIRNCPGPKLYEEFEDNTAKALVGDDNTWTVSDYAHEFFNARTVIETWKQIGVTTTTDSLEPRDPAELDFLSAKTVFLDGMALPVYERAKLMTSLLYAPHAHRTPATILQRTAAMLQIGWTDLPFRKFCRDVIHWLLQKFDKILADEEEWNLAKCGILTDTTLYKLFMGQDLVLKAQGIFDDINTEWGIITHQEFQLESTRKINKSNKKEMSQVIVVKKKRTRKSKALKKKQQNKPKVQVIGPVRGGRNPTKKMQRRPRARNNNQLAGRGSVRNQRSASNRKIMCIEEDEYIGEVTGQSTAGFATTTYPINIGQAGTFPWGSGVVKNNFEKYKFEYLEFYFKREVSEFASAGTTGKVMLSVDSDASDGPPTTKQAVEDTDPHVDGMPCENIRLVVPTSILNKMNSGHYIRPAGLPGAADIKTYDVGNLFVSTQGLSVNNVSVGELHVRYKCSVFIPVLEAGAGAPMNNSVSWYQNTTSQALTTNVLANIGPLTATTNGIGITGTNPATPPVGNYLITFMGTFSGTTITACSLILNKNGTNLFPNGEAAWSSTTAVTEQPLSQQAYVSCNGTDIITAQVIATGTGLTVTGDILWQAI
jgi:hypothetical protein